MLAIHGAIMPRARIPYAELEYAANLKYPSPLFRNTRILRKDRYNNVKAPTVVYDRSTGNYKAIGWKITILTEQFSGIKDYGKRIGYSTEYKQRVIKDILYNEDLNY